VPRAQTLLIEAFIDAVDELVTFSTIQCGREAAHDFGIGVQGRGGRPVAVAPTSHQQALRMDLLIVRHPTNLVSATTQHPRMPRSWGWWSDDRSLAGWLTLP
jgi:hypothetical protein